MPSKGVGINATMTPFSEFKRRPGEIISPYEWHIAPIKNKRQVRLLRYDTNYWKSFYRNRVLTSRGDPGAFSINGERITDRFRLLATSFQRIQHCRVGPRPPGGRLEAHAKPRESLA